MHTKPKLALAILTSPSAAFEEILERKLLGTAVLITVLAGTAAACVPVAFASVTGHIQLFLLGKNNPVCWLGLCLLYAFLTSKLLKWIGTDIDFASLFTIMGWSQILLLLTQIVLIVGAVAGTAKNPNTTLINFIYAANMGLPIWYIAAIAIGIRTKTGAPLLRGILTYLVVAMAGGIAFTLTYGNALLAPFGEALPGVKSAARTVAGLDQTPWFAVGVIGLLVGLWQIGKSLSWEARTTGTAVFAAAVAGAVLFGVYARSVWFDAAYIKRLGRANQLYQKAKRTYENNKSEWLADPQRCETSRRLYADSAKRLEALLPVFKTDLGLLLDIADIHYLAGNNRKSVSNYRKFLHLLKEGSVPEEQANPARARAYSGIGAAYDAEGNYEQAIEQFKKAADAWPEFRDPWVRMAVTYDRMGEYEKAINASDKHAIRKLDSEAAVAWVALAQAFLHTGDRDGAKTAIAMVQEKDKKLAKRIGDRAKNWLDAVSKLTPDDLRFPLEKEPAPTPKKPRPKKPAAKRK